MYLHFIPKPVSINATEMQLQGIFNLLRSDGDACFIHGSGFTGLNVV
mgnify:CR=1 FL=1